MKTEKIGPKGFLIVCCFWLASCSLISYENRSHYELEIDETVEIYYTTNSCCHYCLIKEQNLRHIELLGSKTVNKSLIDCAGCNNTVAYIFSAKSIGIDTIRLAMIGGGEKCEDMEHESESYIVEVQ